MKCIHGLADILLQNESRSNGGEWRLISNVNINSIEREHFPLIFTERKTFQ